jgi:large subunit ribosomal protein L37Ae
MAEKEKLGSMKRFGARYGRVNKLKVAKLESSSRSKHKCPYCNFVKVKRKSVGIWHCDKCNSTFAGRAYTPATNIKIKQE